MKLINWFGSKIIEVTPKNSENWASDLLHQFVFYKNLSKKSHKIGGRWENTYLKIDHVPSVCFPMRVARDLGKEHLGISSVVLLEAPKGTQQLHAPFWFNIAHKGEKTGLHDHAHLSILSGVLYLQAEEGCGDLYFRKEGVDDLTFRPEVGKLIIFPPLLQHGVQINESSKDRISFAFNLFPFPLIYSEW